VNEDKKKLARKMHLRVVGDSKPKRILFVSNAPWASTGYGQQTAQLTTRLKKDEYEVAIAANYGLEASNSDWNSEAGSIPVYSRGHEQWSNDVIPAHMYDWTQKDPDAQHLLMTLFDVWVFKGDKWADWPVASWVPVDHLPCPPDVSAWCRKKNVHPVAMSKFGQAMLENVGIQASYVPHGIENVFEPTETIIDNVGEIPCREFMNIPEDSFVVGMNAANKGVYPNRKAFGENLLAFSMFARKHKDAILYLHTDASGSLGGIRLTELIASVGIPKEQVIFVDPYILRAGVTQKTLAGIYTAMDVLLATSYGEGFGIPTIEAQACGTRVIVSDFAASSELCGDGWKITGQPLWDAPQKSWFHIPNVDAIVEALQNAYNAGRQRSLKAMEFAEQYKADTVYENLWKPTLKAIWQDKNLFE
jgi:hypothetical protein